MRVSTFSRETAWRDAVDIVPPNVVVVKYDMEMPSANAIARRILELHPGCHVVVLADRVSDVAVIDAQRLGATTIVSTQQGLDELVTTIRSMPKVDSPLDGDIVVRAIKRLQRTEGELLLEADEIDRAILRRLVLGLTDQQISDEVHIAVQSVKNRVSRMLDRFQKANRTQLAIFYERQRMSG
jgi:DNA-binding NarL/FixJ family response regulator